MSSDAEQAAALAADEVTRWWVGVRGIDPERTRIEHLHAAVTTWLDPSEEHRDRVKPHALSPLAADRELGFELGILAAEPRRRMEKVLSDGAPIRLGNQNGLALPPRLIAREPWSSLAEFSGATRWRIEFVTPTTFRRHDRTTPLPAPDSILRGLAEIWNTFAPPDLRQGSRRFGDDVWIEDIEGVSRRVRLAIGKDRGRPLVLSGFVGRLTIRCDDPPGALHVDRLLRLAPYSGVGSFKHRGLGVTRLGSIGLTRPRHPSPSADDAEDGDCSSRVAGSAAKHGRRV